MCHTKQDGTMREIETPFFDGKCKEFIEGYRFVPFGEQWIRSDGEIFYGEMVCLGTGKHLSLIKRFQAQHEADEAMHLAELGALIEEIYSEDLEVIDNV